MISEIETLLKESIGLDPASVGRTIIETALRDRMRASSTRTVSEYLDKLRHSEAEMQELVENVVVPETSFFRDRESFSALAQIVMKEWLPGHPQGVLRILSIPCSSGEEPYSIAMALLDAGLAPSKFVIEAADISERALARARRGSYGRNSFRGRDLDFRRRHFEQDGDYYRLANNVRGCVDFQKCNLLSDQLAARVERYDIIFCRNVLIYFDVATQERVTKTLRRLLTSDGYLFVGPSEAFAMRAAGFTAVGYPRAFAYRKTSPPVEASAGPTKKAAVAAARLPEKPRPEKLSLKSTPLDARGRTAPVLASLSERPMSDLEAAKRLADCGKLKEAATICEDHLREKRTSAGAHYLLGVLRDAMGDEEQAAECYRKVLYLEPGHAEALAHLALLREQRGDRADAERLYRRAKRLEHAASPAILETISGAIAKGGGAGFRKR